ncbi:Uncharacterised protein [Streptococcus equi subsp. equi]|nr:hypothetical protein SE071780_01972 [Streptococcus equi subsp. equi]QTZ30124.1 hypothetical protein GDAKBCAL_01621 [Streptococcus equi subsp. zooepidemicus]SEO34553.1 hypothetical protein SAMN05421801_1544 [Streptococcus equi]QUQ77404.1 hypothetical protein JDBNIEOD_00404 [Streptococcus equi subsp. zooepidemicus]CRQ86346.1 Uncharacterised protein [Streptococcus equi subsp. equi]
MSVTVKEGQLLLLPSREGTKKSQEAGPRARFCLLDLW